MANDFEEHYLDVLQNIEMAIVSIYEEQPELTDYGVDNALAGLIRVYQAQLKGRAVPDLALKELERQVYEAVKVMCDLRLDKPASPGQPDETVLEIGSKTPDEIVACLRRIRRSISLWTKQGGRQGYLNYIDSFLGR